VRFVRFVANFSFVVLQAGIKPDNADKMAQNAQKLKAKKNFFCVFCAFLWQERPWFFFGRNLSLLVNAADQH